ncbi:MAG: IS110 family transposase [Gammaproteobacteria bacterium]|nr:IS110 family transposase [Gammaproteobacteria bacterium]
MTSTRFVGIDISKATFDVAFSADLRAVYSNDPAGFTQFRQALADDDHVVMEATGTYFLKLATFLSAQDITVSVINPAVISYFARMRLVRTKTDRVDADIIREYGCFEALSAWTPTEDVFIELNQLDSHLNGLQGDRNRVIGRLEALQQCAKINAYTLEDLQQQLTDLEVRIKQTEKELVVLTQAHFPELLTLLTSIKGIGQKTAIMFIVLTRGFTRFSSPKHFASFLGLSSFIRQSGTSVRGSGGISKMGNPRMRQLLYMAALTARTRNSACKTFAERLAGNGKPPKVVRIAVANKLIRQAFAVCLKGESYSECYV